jgi:sec-independent protein translocase protein TatA
MLQNIGLSEILLIAIVALLLFGPNKLPEIGRSLGKAVREFRNGAKSLIEEVTREVPNPQTQPQPQQGQASTAAAAKLPEPDPIGGFSGQEPSGSPRRDAKNDRRLPE